MPFRFIKAKTSFKDSFSVWSSVFKVKSGLAQMSKGGLIMDVINAEQARIAEGAGACAVMVIY